MNVRILGIIICVLVTLSATASELRLRAIVEESQVVRPEVFQPPKFGTGSPGSGVAILRIDTTTGEFSFDMEIEDISAVILDSTVGPNSTAIHIRAGTPDVRGPIIIDCHHAARTLLPDTNGVTPTAAGFLIHAEGVIARFQGALDTGYWPEQMIDLLRAGRVFVAVHTTTNDLFRTGSIRGNFELFAEELRLRAILDEGLVVRPEAFQPPKFGTGSPGFGPADLVVNTTTGHFVFDMDIIGIAPVILDNTVGPNMTGIHVHRGTPDVRGPFIIDVHHFAREALPESNGVMSTRDGFRMHAEGVIDQIQGTLDSGFSRDGIIDFLRTGESFVVVHTTTNDLFRTGAIRGHFNVISVVPFVRGDCNGDGRTNIADPSCILNWLFLGISSPGCLASLDTNGSGDVNIADAIYVLSFIFRAGRLPVAPYPECGDGSLESDRILGCGTSASDCQ